MFPLVTNFFCLILTTFYLPKLNHQYTVKCFCLIIFLLSCSTQFKFSFLLSSSLISILAMFEMYKKKQFTKSIFFASLIGLLVILPRELFEFINLNHNIIYNFLNPITDNYSSTNFNISLKHGVGNSALLPIWIFLPYPNISEFTYTLGPAVLYFIFEMKLKYNINKKILIISFLFILIALLFSQAVGRFFIEPFIWLLFFSLFYTKKKQNNIMKFFEKVLIIGSIIFVLFLGYFSLNLFKGNLNNELFNKVLEKNADGYLLFKWANEVIPDNSVIISTHRSISFYKHKAIPYEFRLYTSTERIDSFNYYMSEILKEKPMFILYSGSEFNNKTDILKNCRGDLYKFKKNVGYTAGRSPFFKKNKYDGYIFYLDPKKIKKCKL